MKKAVAILALTTVVSFGGSVAADNNYPPSGGGGGGGNATGGGGGSAGGELPRTGTDSNELLPIAGGLVLVGAGLAGVAWYRRKPVGA